MSENLASFHARTARSASLEMVCLSIKLGQSKRLKMVLLFYHASLATLTASQSLKELKGEISPVFNTSFLVKMSYNV